MELNLKRFVSKFIQERPAENFPHLYIVGSPPIIKTRSLGPIARSRKPSTPPNPTASSRYPRASMRKT
jgi:hypothetical protein